MGAVNLASSEHRYLKMEKLARMLKAAYGFMTSRKEKEALFFLYFVVDYPFIFGPIYLWETNERAYLVGQQICK